MRNMSFKLTTNQFRKRTKTVTRRLGWWNLKPGEIVMGVEKSQGLKKGERVTRLGRIRIISAKPEPLSVLLENPQYGIEEVRKEGFADDPMLNTPDKWVPWFCSTHKGCTSDTPVNRIEFEYLT